MSRQHPQQPPASRRVKNVVSEADRSALKELYTFLPPTTNDEDEKAQHELQPSQRSSTSSHTWQDRMVQKYHDHLYKEYALADLSRGPGKIGLRWRTRQEVIDGRGERTCGNKHCPKSRVIDSVRGPSNQELVTLEVPFAYEERGVKKKELVKLKLCKSCKGLVHPKSENSHVASVKANDSNKEPETIAKGGYSDQDDYSFSSSSSRQHRGRKKKRKHIHEEERRRRKKRKRKED